MNSVLQLRQKILINCIVESWLYNEIQDNELVINKYHLAKLDHNKHGSILIYIHTSFVFFMYCLRGLPTWNC